MSDVMYHDALRTRTDGLIRQLFDDQDGDEDEEDGRREWIAWTDRLLSRKTVLIRKY
jgi:hypothetical protein